MRRLWPPLLALAVLAGLVLLFRYARQFDPASGRGSDFREAGMGDVTVQLEGTRILAREAGRLQWSMRAGRIDLRRGADDDLESYRAADFTDIRDGVLYREGRPESYFSARSATFERSAQRFFIRGDIRFRTIRGDVLRAEECVWAEREDFVRLPKGGRGVFRGQRITTPSLLYSPRRRLLECPQGAEALFHGHPLRAAALYWDVNTDRVRCPGLVSGSRPNLTFVAQDVVYDLKARRLSANSGSAILRIEGEGEDWEGF